jgi:hypothetical protein
MSEKTAAQVFEDWFWANAATVMTSRETARVIWDAALAAGAPGCVCVPVDEPFGWWTEWDGDESDFGNYIFTMDKDELDTEHLWIPLYARPK